MKILMVMPTHISEGGTESVALSLWKGMNKQGHEVDFVCHGFKIGSYEAEMERTGTKIYHIPGKSENFMQTISQFNAIVKDGEYDVVHAHMNATSGIYLQIAKRLGVKVLVAHSHISSMKAYTTSIVHGFVNLFEKKRTNKYANIKIACSDKAGKWLYGNMKFDTILNAVDIDNFIFNYEVRVEVRKKLYLNKKDKVFIHIGGFLGYKNHSFLIDIFREIYKKDEKSKLLLVGDGVEKEVIEQKIENYGLTDSVLMLGRRQDVHELLQAADVFLLPSLSEGNPVALVEAAISGMKCLISKNIASDTINYFIDKQIEQLPIENTSETLKLWVDRSFSYWERIKYDNQDLFEISANKMVEQTLDLYKRELMK